MHSIHGDTISNGFVPIMTFSEPVREMHGEERGAERGPAGGSLSAGMHTVAQWSLLSWTSGSHEPIPEPQDTQAPGLTSGVSSVGGQVVPETMHCYLIPRGHDVAGLGTPP